MPQFTPRPWTPQEDHYLRDHLGETHDAIGCALDRSRAAIRNRCHELGIVRDRLWSADDVQRLRDAYATAGARRAVAIADLAAAMGRNKANVCRKARSLGLTNKHRQHTPEQNAATGERAARRIRENGHPRGALGMTHTAESRKAQGEGLRATWERHKAAGTGWMSRENRQRGSDRMSQRHDSDPRLRTGFSYANSGTREDLGIFVRSAWEANYARYLNWLIAQGQIKSWRYEPVTFWFEAIKRGVRSYKPDFEVVNLDDSIEYHEVKGWDYARGQTARKRMAKYYPAVKLVLIDEDSYKAIAKWKALIPGWETQRRRPPPRID